MNYIVLPILFFLSGFFMKFSDDAYDVDGNKRIAIIFSVLCGVCSAFASVLDIGAAYIFISILIGNFIALKVDGIHHMIALILFIVILLAFGIPPVNIFILIICICGASLDEVGHEMASNFTDNSFVLFFFEYRFVMKIVLFLLAVCGVISFLTFVMFILFEVSYLLAGVVFELSKKEKF